PHADDGYLSPLISISELPSLNAALNSLSAVFLCAGFFFIKSGHRNAHRNCMLTAFACSVLFLTSYLVYHYHVGSVPFKGQGWVRPVYVTILLTHTILALPVVPAALSTSLRGGRRNFPAARRIPRWP